MRNSRLKVHQQKQYKKSILMVVSGVVILILVLVIFGFKILLNTSLFVAGIFSPKETKTIQTKEDFYGTFEMDTVPTATNSAKFIVSGTATNYDKIDFYLNSEKIDSTSTFVSNSFTKELDGLNTGQNTFYAVATKTTSKNEKKSEEFKIILNKEKPKLEVTDPKDGTTVNSYDITVKGTTDKTNSVKINGSPTVVDAEGKFNYTFRIKDGENKIEVSSEDDAGNIETKTITLTYSSD